MTDTQRQRQRLEGGEGPHASVCQSASTVDEWTSWPSWPTTVCLFKGEGKGLRRGRHQGAFAGKWALLGDRRVHQTDLISVCLLIVIDGHLRAVIHRLRSTRKVP